MNNSWYLYGIVRSPLAKTRKAALGIGVGDPPAKVKSVSHQQIAAVVSEVSSDAPPGAQVRGLRRDMTAHTSVLERLMAHTTVLPVRFGVCIPSRHELVENILRSQYDWLDQQLERLAGAVELTLRITYKEDEVLRELQQQQPVLSGAGRLSGTRRYQRVTYSDQIERGQRIAAAVQVKREQESQALVAHLRPLAREVAVSRPPSDMTVLKASFLVDRQSVEQMDQAIESLYKKMKRLADFEYVGPLPPYSFASMRLPYGG